MTNDAEAQEIHGTVVSSGRFPEPAADDRTEPAEVADQADLSDPEDEEDQEDQEEERPDSTDLGHDRVAADLGAGDDVTDPDAVIIDPAGDEDDEALAGDEDDEAPAEPERGVASARDEADGIPADDEAPAAMAGFARTPVASPASAAADDISGTEPGIDDAEGDEGADADAAEVGADSAVTSATVVTVAGADAVPEADVIAEASRPGVPRDAEVPAMSGVATDPAQLHEQWSAIQSSFVDDPRASVAAAADLVSEAIEALVASVQERERGLRGEWERDGADTEDLRNTLRGYRGLLDQLAGL